VKFYDYRKKPKGGQFARFVCECECGKQHIARADNLKNGHVISCGCVKTKPKGQAAFDMYYNSYIRSAKNREHVFNLTEEDFKKCINKNCHYCNSIPTLLDSPNYQELNGSIQANGIDRVKNTTGYEKNNCVPCCSLCNRIKHGNDYQRWLQYLEQLYLFRIQNKIEIYQPPNNIEKTLKSLYRSQIRNLSEENKRKATGKRKGMQLEFLIPYDLFIQLSVDNCHYYGVKPYAEYPLPSSQRIGVKMTVVHKNGIDRLDSLKHYTVENCVTACSICNIGKNRTSPDEFKTHLDILAKNYPNIKELKGI